MRVQTKGVILATAAAFLLFSCKNEDDHNPEPVGAYSDGVVVINGGNFGQNNGTLSFLNRTNQSVVENLFNLVNGQPSLPPDDGRIEGYAEAGERGILLFDHSVNGQDKVVFVDGSTFERKSELTAPLIENPRDVVVISDTKAYVTNWDALNDDWSYRDGYIAVVNPKTGESTGKISIGQGPENMVFHQNKAYVGRASWTSNKLTVVNTTTDEVVKSLDFESWPSPVGVDASGKLWVKEGNRFHRINTATDEVEATLTAGNDATRSIGAATLTADKANIIFVLSYSNEDTNWLEVGSTYFFNTSASSISVSTALLPRAFASLGADPKTQTIYAAVIPSFSQAGYVIRVNATGALQDSVRVEVAPEGFFFK